VSGRLPTQQRPAAVPAFFQAPVTGGANGLVTVTAAGTYICTYKVQEAGGQIPADAATVTVNVIPADTVTITRGQFTIAQKRWVVTDATSVPDQTLNLTYLNGTAAGHSIGTVPVGALGNWTFDLRGLDDPTTLLARPNVLEATSSFAGASTVSITYE
jgi:hypothetical protein